MHKLQDLKIWHKSLELCEAVYKATADFPKEEKYGLTAQIRRSAVSISSNIAEGAGRNTDGEFCQFLGMSNGSSYELQTQLMIANRLKLMNDNTTNPLLVTIDQLQKMNYKLQESMRK